MSFTCKVMFCTTVKLGHQIAGNEMGSLTVPHNIKTNKLLSLSVQQESPISKLESKKKKCFSFQSWQLFL